VHLVAAATRGDPQAALLWVIRSQRHLAAALADQGYSVSPNLVGRLLEDLGFSLQANVKTREGRQHSDRDAQFQHINDAIERFRRDGQPAISVDTKKKELIGDFKSGGRELRHKGRPEKVRVDDYAYSNALSSSQARAGLSPTGSTTLPPTRAGSASASTTTPPLSSKASAAGGAARAASDIPPQGVCSSLPDP